MEIIKKETEMKYYNNNLNIYVINLDYRPEKFEKVKDNFTEKNINFIKFNAINGKTVCENHVDAYSTIILTDGDSNKEYKIHNNNLKYGEIGCFLSHTTLWQNCIKYNLPYIIIAEDDIIKTNNFSFENILNALNELNNNITTQNWDILYLSKPKNSTINKYNMGFKYKLNSLEYKYSDKYDIEHSEENKLKFVKKTDPRTGLHFYIIKREGCIKCMEQCNILCAPIDIQLWDCKKSLNSYVLNDGLVEEDVYVSDTYSNSLIYNINLYLSNTNTEDIITNNILSELTYINDNKSYEELMYIAYHHLYNKNISKGVLIYLKIIEIYEIQIQPYLYIIELLINDGFNIGDFALLNNLYEEKSNKIKNINIYCACARLFEFQNNLEKALNYYFKALELEPNNIIINYNVGLTIAKSNVNTNHCLIYFDKVFKLDPNFEEVYKSTIVYYNVNKDVENLHSITEYAYNKFSNEHFLYEYAKACVYKPDLTSSIMCFESLIQKILSRKVNDFHNGLTSYDKYVLADCYIKLSKINKWLNNDYLSKKYIFKVLDKLDYYYINYNDTYNVKQTYGKLCLYNKDYNKGFQYYKYGHLYLNKLDTTYSSFFKYNDKNKTLLLFNSGGYSDLIMYSRFLKDLAKKYDENRIIFIINNKLKWMFNYDNLSNVICICESQSQNIIENTNLNLKYDYYCDIFSLPYYLDLKYEHIYYKPYLLQMINKNYYECYFYKKYIQTYIDKHDTKYRKIIAFNWHGNRNNNLYKWQNEIPLTEFEPLFKVPNILWINLQKEKTQQEHYFLNKFSNVLDYTYLLDEKNNEFYDTVNILSNISLLISPDSTILHIASTLNVNTYALIGMCCKWYWTQESYTRWYPNIRILKQSKILYWQDIMLYLRKELLIP